MGSCCRACRTTSVTEQDKIQGATGLALIEVSSCCAYSLERAGTAVHKELQALVQVYKCAATDSSFKT